MGITGCWNVSSFIFNFFNQERVDLPSTKVAVLTLLLKKVINEGLQHLTSKDRFTHTNLKSNLVLVDILTLKSKGFYYVFMSYYYKYSWRYLVMHSSVVEAVANHAQDELHTHQKVVVPHIQQQVVVPHIHRQVVESHIHWQAVESHIHRQVVLHIHWQAVLHIHLQEVAHNHQLEADHMADGHNLQEVLGHHMDHRSQAVDPLE